MTFLKDSFKESGIRFDKARGPAETLDWVYSRFSALDVPVLEEVRRVDKGRLGIPVYVSRYSPGATRLTGSARQMGKGVTPEQAKASAVMELVERFSIFSFLREGVRRNCTMKDLGADALELGQMLSALHLGAEPSMEEKELVRLLPMEWVRAYSPSLARWCYMPFSWFWPINEYNGAAAGNSLEEAAVQGLCEVVERHVCSMITYERLSVPTINPDSVPDGDARLLLDRFSAAGVNVVLKDFSLGLGVPTVGVIAWDPATYPSRSEIVYTAGTATHPERALIRALTEVAQLAGDFDTEGSYVESGLPKFETLAEADYVLESSTTVGLDDLPNCSHDNFRTEVENACHVLSESGLNPLLVDVTHPVLNVPAVYVVIPGNHFRDRTINMDLAFHAARIAATFGTPEHGIRTLGLICEVYPERYDVAFYMGHVLEKAGRYPDALKWYEKALDLDPDSGELASIYCHKGLCLKELGEYAPALEQLQKAREMNPNLKEIFNLMGYCLFKTGRHVEAIEAFEQAINIDPGSAIDYANIASNLRAMGMGEAAVVWYRMALELDPGLKWAKDQMEEVMNSHSIRE